MITFKNPKVSYEELTKAYLDCRKRKRRTQNALNFEINDAEKLYKLYIEINSGKYEIGRSIVFCVDKPVKREIFAADFRDRIIHHLVINRINKYFEEEFIFDTYSCRKGKGTSMAIKRCAEQIIEASENYTKPTYIVKCDLKSFFMTIDKNILYDKLEKFLIKKGQENDEDMEFNLQLIRQIIFNKPQENCIRKQPISHWEGLPKEKSLFNCDENKGLPIGNLTSQIFANFYLSDFDHFMVDKLKIRHYGRYVDDFFFVVHNKKQIQGILKQCAEELSKVGAILHPKKLYIQEVHKGVQFVGGVIKKDRLYVANRTKGNFWDALKKYAKYIENLKDNEITKEDVKHFVGSVNSYLGFLKPYKTFNIRKKLLSSSFMDKWLRYVSIDKKNYSKINMLKHLKKCYF